MKNWYEIGALHRGDFRRACMRLDLEYKEDRGFMDSFFIVEGSAIRMDMLNAWLIGSGRANVN